MMVVGFTSKWEGGNMHGVFSPCMEPTRVSYTLYYWERLPSIHCFVLVCFTPMMVVRSTSMWERGNMHDVFSPCMEPTRVSCTLYYWERFPSIHCFILVCFTHIMVVRFTSMWEGENMHGVFSPCMEPIECHVLFTIGKDPLQSIVLYLCALLTLRMHVTTFFKLSFGNLNLNLYFSHLTDTLLMKWSSH